MGLGAAFPIILDHSIVCLEYIDGLITASTVEDTCQQLIERKIGKAIGNCSNAGKRS